MRPTPAMSASGSASVAPSSSPLANMSSMLPSTPTTTLQPLTGAPFSGLGP